MSVTALPTKRSTAEACVEVRLRTEHATSGESVYLCDYPIDKLERLVQLIPRWGVIVLGDGDVYSNLNGGAEGQFVLDDDDAAFFEVILSTNEDS